MIAFKGFNRHLQATRGEGIFQFEPGKTYEEAECKCAHNGFHCAEEPLCALSYYDGPDDRYFIVKAEGDINQDGNGSRISCTKLTLIKEITRLELAVYACRYMQKYPEREVERVHFGVETIRCRRKGDFAIARGKNPKAAGIEGSYLFLVKEKPDSREIETVYPVYVDGEEIEANRYYGLKGDRLCKKKSC